MKITVVGTGYVGLITGVCLAEHNHEVVCLDNNIAKIEMLNAGKSPIYEDGLENLMVKNSDKITYTVDKAKAYQSAEVVIVGVGTPERPDGSANLSYVYEVARDIAENIQNDVVVIIKSTVPIGTNEKIEKFISENLNDGVKVDVVSNPEFLAQGTAVKDTLCPSRIVIGAQSDTAMEKIKEMYADYDCPFILTDRKSAEMIKYASNDFLALKISYINEIANLCELLGTNIEDVAKGMGFDERIGNKFLNAGIGYGGSCFPKDTKALHWLANSYDYELKTIKAAIEVNEKQKFKLLKKARNIYPSFYGLTIAVLGLTFKPNTDDLRESPSLVNIPVFLAEGARVKAYDPIGIDNFKKLFPSQIEYYDNIDHTIKDADICFIFTDWRQIKEYNLNKFISLMKSPVLLDGRNCYRLEDIPSELNYDSIGRSKIN